MVERLYLHSLPAIQSKAEIHARSTSAHIPNSPCRLFDSTLHDENISKQNHLLFLPNLFDAKVCLDRSISSRPVHAFTLHKQNRQTNSCKAAVLHQPQGSRCGGRSEGLGISWPSQSQLREQYAAQANHRFSGLMKFLFKQKSLPCANEPP